MKPNKNNFCGGAFEDWLEVNLISECNAHCQWCIEKDGYKPKEEAKWWVIAREALRTNAKNIILLGGEPTKYGYLRELIEILSSAGRNVYMTTNGSLLSPEFVDYHLEGLKGINISMHSYIYAHNYQITGIHLLQSTLKDSIEMLSSFNISVRLNCNCIKGYIDSEKEISYYLETAKFLGVKNVRFAELKVSDDFVNIAEILNYKYGLNKEPYSCGCNTNTIINDVNVNFRQMCGLQTDFKNKPENPEQILKKVLYYDGKIYNGWQTIKKELVVTDKQLIELLQEVKEGKKDITIAALELGRELGKVKTISVPVSSGDGCCY